MKRRIFPAPGLSLLITLIFLLAAVPANAQAPDAGLAADSTNPGNEAVLDHDFGVSAPGISNDQRLGWFIRSTMGPRSLIAGAVSAGFGTGLNRPHEYGGTWQGFDRRYKTRLAGIAVANATEVTLGAIWGEYPRYRRVPNEPFGGRVRNVIKMTFVVYRGDGKIAPAYARFIGIAGSNLLSNSWREHSEANLHDAALRTLVGFLGRMGSNTIEEFWPDIRRDLLHK